MHLKEKKKITGTKIKERKFYENFSLDRFCFIREFIRIILFFRWSKNTRGSNGWTRGARRETPCQGAGGGDPSGSVTVYFFYGK